MNIVVLGVLAGMITVHVAFFTTMERVTRLLVHGLLKSKVNWFVGHVMVIGSEVLLLLDNIGVTMLASERNLLDNDLVVLY